MPSRNWNEDFRDTSTEQCWAILEESIRNASSKYTPKYTIKQEKPDHFWTNTKTITAVKRKTEAYMPYRETRDEQNYIEYRRASNRVETYVRMAVRDFERQIVRDAKANPKVLYKYARSKMKTRSAVADLERLDRTMSETDVDEAEILNTFFTGVFILESLENIPTFENRLNNTQLTS